MKSWNPGHKPHPWYAHIFRGLLTRHHKPVTGSTPPTRPKDDDEFHWRYAPLVIKAGGQTLYHVCEEYPGMGYTDAETPMGESLEELISELEMMVQDMKAAAFIQHEIVQGAPYDNWRTRELDKEPSVSWDDDTDLYEEDENE